MGGSLSPRDEVIDFNWDYHSTLHIIFLTKLFVASYTGNALHYYLSDLVCYSFGDMGQEHIF